MEVASRDLFGMLPPGLPPGLDYAADIIPVGLFLHSFRNFEIG